LVKKLDESFQQASSEELGVELKTIVN